MLQLARWIAEYYCCPVEIALKGVLPESVRKEEAGWRERLFVRVVPRTTELPKLTKRQEDVWNVIEEWRELPLQEPLRLTGTTAETTRKLEDKGLITIAPQVSERDPYAHEHILPTQCPAPQRRVGEGKATVDEEHGAERPPQERGPRRGERALIEARHALRPHAELSAVGVAIALEKSPSHLLGNDAAEAQVFAFVRRWRGSGGEPARQRIRFGVHGSRDAHHGRL